MYVDNNLLLSGSVSAAGVVAGQSVTGTGNVLSANTADLSQARDIGAGRDLYARMQVMVAGVGGTSVDMQIITADDAALTTNVTQIGATGPIPNSQLVVGARFTAEVNPRIASRGQRYIGIRYVLVGTYTAGTYFADVGIEIQDGQKFHPSGFAVL